MPRLARTSTLAVAVLALAASALPAVATASHPAKKSACFGKQPTIFSGANGAHLKGTGKGDVIEATGKNVTVSGGGGNDRICIKGGTANGGAGDDKIQLVSGSANGGAGKDTITVLAGSGTVKVDGAADPNTITVPKSRLLKATITPRSGDLLNGKVARVDAPASGGPSFALDVDSITQSPVKLSADNVYTDFDPDNGSYVDFVKALPANGRALAHWTLSWGDGTAAQAGNGGPPAYLYHHYLIGGLHTATATITDDLGTATTHSIVADVGIGPVIVGSYSVVGTTATFTNTVTYGSGSLPNKWWATFGDGTSVSGNGAPPATIPVGGHVYASPGEYRFQLAVIDDHGGEDTYTAYSSFGASPNATMELDYNYLNIPIAGSYRWPSLYDQPFTSGATIESGQELTMNSQTNSADVTIDWGDGETSTYGSASHTFYATKAETRTVTATSRKYDGTLLGTKSWTVHVVPTTVAPSLTAPNYAPEGPIRWSTAGTTLPPAGTFYWEIYDENGGAPPLYGTGPLPATITRTEPSGYAELELEIIQVDGVYSRDYSEVEVTSPAARVEYFGGNEDADWTRAIVAPDVDSSPSVAFSGDIEPSYGAHLTSGALSFGDGTPPHAIVGIGSGSFSSDDAANRHGYTIPGEYVATLTVKDSKGHIATAQDHISVAGKPVATLPATQAAAVGNVVLPLATVSPGANAQWLGYSIQWDDNASPTKPDTFGFGAPPAHPAHTYTIADTYFVTVKLYNDHGGELDLQTVITVT